MKVLLCVFFLLNISVCVSQQSSDEKIENLINESRKISNDQKNKSLDKLQEALKISGASSKSLQKIYSAIANHYVGREAHYLALTYFFKELEIIQNSDQSDIYTVWNNIGGSYFKLGQLDKARKYWNMALNDYNKHLLKHPEKYIPVEATIIYNNLAVLEKEDGNFDKALTMQTKFRSKNLQLGDNESIIMANENLADIYLNKKNYVEAHKLIDEALMLADKIKSDYDIASLTLTKATAYITSGTEVQKTLELLRKSLNISIVKSYNDLELEAYKKMVLLYEQQDKFDEALKYMHLANKLTEKINTVENNKKITVLELEQIEKLNQFAELNKRQRKEYFLIGSIIILVLLVITIFLMFKLQKSKSRQKNIEKEILAKEIERKNKEIKNNNIQILQNTEIIKSAQKELEQLKDISDGKLQPSFNKLIHELKSAPSVLKKDEFEKLFMEIDDEFYKRILQKHPNLSKNELRLCAFLKLNLSSKEISAITQQTPHSITVARSRLRKKMNIEKDESLPNYFIKF